MSSEMVSAPLIDDRHLAEAAFACWAAAQPHAPREVASLFRDVSVSHEPVGLLATEIAGRRVFWRSVPANGKARVTFPTVAIETVDAWTADAIPLRDRSNHIAICDDCGGNRKVTCGRCGGRGSWVCPSCNGARKAYGYASNGSRRLLNCVTCRGKGEVDCDDCRRGVASCAACGGEGRVQRWIELETWQRVVASRHPQALADRFGWDDDPTTDAIARDTDVTFDITRTRALTPTDLGSVPQQWLAALAPPLKPGERVMRQRMRIARLPVYNVAYRLNENDEHVAFTGRQLAPPPQGTPNALSARAEKLRSLRQLMFAIAIAGVLIAFGRGAFYRSVATSISVVGFIALLASLYGAYAESTALRRRTREWLIAAAASFVIIIAFTLFARPRLAHAQELVAAADVDAAEEELNALGDDVPANVWADFRVAQIRATNDVDAARAALAQIPAELPQHAIAAAAVDDVLLRAANQYAKQQLLAKAAESLAMLSGSALRRPATIDAARTIYVPLAQREIRNGAWSDAAASIAAAKRLGVPTTELDDSIAALHRAGSDAARKASRVNDAQKRLTLRLSAEQILSSWEIAAGASGSAELTALRSAMAHDVAAAEKNARRRGE